MEINLEFKTHRIILSELIGTGFVKITNYVMGQVYQDMVTSIMLDKNANMRFVANERILLNNFLCSLVSFHNRGENVAKGDCPLIIAFKEEIDYYSYCVDQDLPFEEQQWFKTAYIKTNIDDARILINNASISLIRSVYPEYLDYSQRIIEYIPPIKPEIKKFKYQPSAYQAFLNEKGIDCLYHFSNIKNFESIKKHGICSIRYLNEHNIAVNFSSSDSSRQIDRHKKLDEYVHLSFERKNPMLFVALAEGRLAEYVIFQISTDVIFLLDTMYTQCNAAKANAVISGDIHFLMEIPFEKFHNKPYNKDSQFKDYFMSEVLVKDRVTTDSIIGTS